MTNKDKILITFKQKNGVVKLKEITEQGINKYHLLKLVETGVVEKLQRGIYKLSEYEINDFDEIKKIVPSGIICLYSAWNFYELTTYMPHEYHIAIEQKSKIKLPDYPPLKLYYWNKSVLSIGVKTVKIENTEIEIYDIEKSVCDAVKFRNKIGKDTLNEILTEYLKLKVKNIDKLIKYAKLLRIERILQNYLDVLL